MVDLQVDLNLPRHRSELPLVLQKLLLYIFPAEFPPDLHGYLHWAAGHWRAEDGFAHRWCEFPGST